MFSGLLTPLNVQGVLRNVLGVLGKIGSIGGAEKLLLAKVKNAFGRIGIFTFEYILLESIDRLLTQTCLLFDCQ